MLDRRSLLASAAGVLLAGATGAKAGPGMSPAAPVLRSQIRLGAALAGGIPAGSRAVCSPASVASVLSALSHGGDAALRAAILQVLSAGDDDVAPISELRSALASLRGAASAGSVVFKFANAVAMAAPEDNPALAALRRDGAEIFVGGNDVATRINRWVRETTNGEIPRIISRPLAPDALVAANALYFKGLWLRSFNKSDTRPGQFNMHGGRTATAPMMHLSGRLPVRRDDRFVAVDLAYNGERFAMTLLTTRTGAAAPEDFRSALDWLSAEGCASANVVLTMPRFDARSELELLPALDRLGLDPARRSRTALIGFSNTPQSISDIRQRVVLQVDEDGSKAAAATAAVVTRSAPRNPEVIRVTFDRPFWYALRDRDSGLIPVMGFMAGVDGAERA
jgi:hypothetical protein